MGLKIVFFLGGGASFNNNLVLNKQVKCAKVLDLETLRLNYMFGWTKLNGPFPPKKKSSLFRIWCGLELWLWCLMPLSTGEKPLNFCLDGLQCTLNRLN